MKLRTLFTDDSAVSPVVGVILMVAITVLLAATAASFFLGIGQQAQTSAPTAAITFDYEANRTTFGGYSYPTHSLTISHQGGDTLNANQVYIYVHNAHNTDGELNVRKSWAAWSSSGSVSEIMAGSSVTIDRRKMPTGSGASVPPHGVLKLSDADAQVTWTDPGSSQSFVLAEWKGPAAG